MRQETVDLAALECARIGAPERWVRELLAENGRPMTNDAWRRYWQKITRLAQADTPGRRA